MISRDEEGMSKFRHLIVAQNLIAADDFYLFKD
jgi:hypothetical protein